MELNPVNVRGKRKRAGNAKQSRASARPRKRLAKGLSSNAPSQQQQQQPRGGTRSRAQARKISLIEEKVPFEILLRIFLCSENVNFARASHRIGKFLSDLQTRREVFIHAFAPQWLADRTAARDEEVRCMGNPELQSALLEYSWVNVRFIAECFAQCARKAPELFQGRNLFGHKKVKPEEFVVENFSDVESSANMIEAEFTSSFEVFKNMDRTIMWNHLAVSRANDPRPVAHREARIPETLLLGSWDDDEALKKFFWLAHARFRILEGHTWETRSSAFSNAVNSLRGNGAWVLELFQVEDFCEDWPDHVTDEAVEALRSAWREYREYHGRHPRSLAHTRIPAYVIKRLYTRRREIRKLREQASGTVETTTTEN